MKNNIKVFLLVFIFVALIGNLVKVLITGPPQRQHKVTEETIKEPYIKGPLEELIKDKLSHNPKFSNIDYAQWDPMEIELYHISNTFKFEGSKVKHIYTARVGINEDNTLQLFYLTVDDIDILWDEEGEDNYIRSKE